MQGEIDLARRQQDLDRQYATPPKRLSVRGEY
jgi:hypothetical protein